MSNPQSTSTPAPAQMSDRDLEQVTGGLLPAVAPSPVHAPSEPLLPAVQRGLIGLL